MVGDKPARKTHQACHNVEPTQPRRSGSFRLSNLERFGSVAVLIIEKKQQQQPMKTPELIDIFRFFVGMHRDEETARMEYKRFLAGELPPHVLAYCRHRVQAEGRGQVDPSEGD